MTPSPMTLREKISDAFACIEAEKEDRERRLLIADAEHDSVNVLALRVAIQSFHRALEFLRPLLSEPSAPAQEPPTWTREIENAGPSGRSSEGRLGCIAAREPQTIGHAADDGDVVGPRSTATEKPSLSASAQPETRWTREDVEFEIRRLGRQLLANLDTVAMLRAYAITLPASAPKEGT